VSATFICGNKIEEEDRKVQSKHVKYHLNVEYGDVSVKENYNLKTPFLWLGKKLLRDDNLVTSHTSFLFICSLKLSAAPRRILTIDLGIPFESTPPPGVRVTDPQYGSQLV
jgi:hypothetical protein